VDDPTRSDGGVPGAARAAADRVPRPLFSRSGVVVLAKPSGLPTQAPAGIPSVESWLRARLPAGAYLGVPHRLDRAVSGVILMATTPRAARQLSRQFERRQIEKTYVAIVADFRAEGDVAADTFQWHDRIAKQPDVAAARIVAAADPHGRDAVTIGRRLGATAPGRALLELRPLTGRMHQLRLQAAHRGMPVVGDLLYGGPALEGDAAIDERASPIALHALFIRFRDPDLSEEVTVEAALPDFWPAAARHLLPTP